MKTISRIFVALMGAIAWIPSSASAAEDVYLGDITVVAPDNVYSTDCVDTLMNQGTDAGCNWDGQCGIGIAYAVPFNVKAGWYKAQVKSGAWGTHGPSCGATTVLEHTAVHIVVPSTRGDTMVGETTLDMGDAIYFATNSDGNIYFVFEDIDNSNNGGTVVVSLWETENRCGGNNDASIDEDGDGTSDCTDDDGDGYAETQGDCNDRDPSVFPCAQELYDGKDNDCDGLIDNPGNASGCGCGDGNPAEGCQGAVLTFGGALFLGLWRRRYMRQNEAPRA